MLLIPWAISGIFFCLSFLHGTVVAGEDYGVVQTETESKQSIIELPKAAKHHLGRGLLGSLGIYWSEQQVQDICKSYGCRSGKAVSATSPQHCYRLFRCFRCKSRTSTDGFCEMLPLENKPIVLVQGILEIDEMEIETNNIATFKNVEDGHDYDDSDFDDSESEQSFFQSEGPEIQITTIPYGKSLNWEFTSTSTGSSIRDCDISIHNTIFLKFNVFIQQLTIQQYQARSPSLTITGSFHDPEGQSNLAGQCTAPVSFTNPIRRNEILRMELNAHLDSDFYQSLHHEALAARIAKSLKLKLTCKARNRLLFREASCAVENYVTCVKVSCQRSPSWKRQQITFLRESQREREDLKDKVKERHERMKRAVEETSRKKEEYLDLLKKTALAKRAQRLRLEDEARKLAQKNYEENLRSRAKEHRAANIQRQSEDLQTKMEPNLAGAQASQVQEEISEKFESDLKSVVKPPPPDAVMRALNMKRGVHSPINEQQQQQQQQTPQFFKFRKG